MITFEMTGTFEGLGKTKEGAPLLRIKDTGASVAARRPGEEVAELPVVLKCGLPAIVPGEEIHVKGTAGWFRRSYTYKKFGEEKRGTDEGCYFYADSIEPVHQSKTAKAS